MERDRRDGRQPGLERVGDILDRLLRETRLLEKGEEIGTVWTEVAGPHVASHTRVHSWRGGVLTVAVDSAPLRQELEVFLRQGLLENLRKKVRGSFVSELRFRLV